MEYQLFLANKTYSGWGLRVWLLFEHFGIAFHHRVIPLYTSEFAEFKRAHSPARQLPALAVVSPGSWNIVWDSLSITEFLNDAYPDLGVWPRDPMARASARSLCAEMHSGFKALRSNMPVNLKRIFNSFRPDGETQADIDRVQDLWAWTRTSYSSSGSFLLGDSFTAVDAFFAPVATRFRTYAIDLRSDARSYCDLLLNHPATIEYVRDAELEPWLLAHNEFDQGS